MGHALGSASPGDVFALAVDHRTSPLVVVGRAPNPLTNQEEPVACVLDWLGTALPPLDEIAKLAPMPYRTTTEAGARRRRWDGRPMAGRANVGDAELRYVGSIALPSTLSDATRASGHSLYVDVVRRAVAESWSNRETWTPPAFEGPAPLAIGQWAELVDDDGVLVIASRQGLAERFASRSYDYSFPKELVEGARARVMFGWQTEREGNVAVTMVRGDRDKDRALGDYRGGSCLDVRGDELVLAMAYGTFTRGCDEHGDMTVEEDDSYAAFRVPEGRYRVGVLQVNDDDDDDVTGVAQYVILLVPTTNDDEGDALDDVVSLATSHE
jgi:hypothetical protein